MVSIIPSFRGVVCAEVGASCGSSSIGVGASRVGASRVGALSVTGFWRKEDRTVIAFLRHQGGFEYRIGIKYKGRPGESNPQGTLS